MKRFLVAFVAVACVIAAAAAIYWSRLPTEASVIARFDSMPGRSTKAAIAALILSHDGHIDDRSISIDSDVAQYFEFSPSDLGKAASSIQTRIPVRQTSIFNEYMWACFIFDQAGILVNWKHRNWVAAF